MCVDEILSKKLMRKQNELKGNKTKSSSKECVTAYARPENVLMACLSRCLLNFAIYYQMKDWLSPPWMSLYSDFTEQH